MSDPGPGLAKDDAYEVLKARADALERQLKETEIQTTRRLRESELKAEAVRAGIVDLDGLRLLDATAIASHPDESFDAASLVGKLRREKPWLFGGSSSSSTSTAPAVASTRRKLATDMSVEEWRAARAELLRRR